MTLTEQCNIFFPSAILSIGTILSGIGMYPLGYLDVYRPCSQTFRRNYSRVERRVYKWGESLVRNMGSHGVDPIWTQGY